MLNELTAMIIAVTINSSTDSLQNYESEVSFPKIRTEQNYNLEQKRQRRISLEEAIQTNYGPFAGLNREYCLEGKTLKFIKSKGKGKLLYLPGSKTIIAKANLSPLEEEYYLRFDNKGKVITFQDEKRKKDITNGESYLQYLMDFLLEINESAKNNCPFINKNYGNMRVELIENSKVEKPKNLQKPYQTFKVFPINKNKTFVGINEVILYVTKDGVIEQFTAQISLGVFNGTVKGKLE